MARRETGIRIHLANAQRNTRNAAIATIIACLLTGCMFGDETARTAQTGVAASFTDCIPKECFYGCCTGPAAGPDPRLMGGDAWVSRCSALRTNAIYAQYMDLLLLEVNLCSQEFAQGWGDCTSILPQDVEKPMPGGGNTPAGLHFNECPPSGDWMAYPSDDVTLTPQEP